MNIHKILCGFLVVTMLGASFNNVEAYNVTKTASFRINDIYTLYLISYAFGHEKYDFSLPAIAERSSASSSFNNLNYSLKTPEGLTVKDGQTASLIIGDVKKLGDRYIAPVGTSTEFTLAVLHEKSSSSSRANTLVVDSLSFLIGDNASKLQKHELIKYQVSATGTDKIVDNK